MCHQVVQKKVGMEICSHRTNIKFYKDTDPFYFWVQVILGKVGCLFIFIPFYLYAL